MSTITAVKTRPENTDTRWYSEAGKRITAQLITHPHGYCWGIFRADGASRFDGGWRLLPRRVYKTQRSAIRAAERIGCTISVGD